MVPTRRLAASVAVAGVAIPFMEYTHQGFPGLLFSLVASGAVLYYTKPDNPTEQETARQDTQEYSLMQRLLHGKSTREPQYSGTTTHTPYEGDDDFADLHRKKEPFTFSSLLRTGWEPSANSIFLARLEDGTDSFLPLDKIVHIALAGNTRQGKTSIIRGLLLQLCPIANCVLLDPHYTPYDVDIDEDWTPFLPYLKNDPAICRQFSEIERTMRYAATTLLEKRRALRFASKPVGRHTFLFLDEYPAIVAEIPEIAKYTAKILREGGKYGIHAVIASQDFQVKTIDPSAKSGGAIRDNFSTVLYVGGDKTTASVLLDIAIPQSIEPKLGKGPVYLRSPECKLASYALTPWTDNEALYARLGPSTYVAGDPTDDTEEEDFATDRPAITTTAIVPIVADKRPTAQAINITVLCAAWNGGINSVAKIEAAFGMSHAEAYKAYKMIKAQAGEPLEEPE